PRTASLEVVATDRLSGADASASLRPQLGVVVQSPPRFGPGALAAPASVLRPTSFTATATVTNTGQATARLDAAALRFSSPGLSSTAAGDNPTSVAGGAAATFRFTVNVAADAAGGDSFASLDFGFSDSNSSVPGIASLALAPGLFVRVNSEPTASLSTNAVRVILGNSVSLTGAATDPDPGDTLVYGWSIESRPPASLSTAGSFRPNDSPASSVTSFTPDVVGVYSVSLVAFDGTTLSAPVFATISVDRPRPVASIDASPVATLHLPVRLEGGESHDPLGSVLTYHWSFLSKPASSVLTEGALQPNNSPLASFTRFCPDRKGAFVVGLNVSVGSSVSLTAATTVPVEGVPPTVAVLPTAPALVPRRRDWQLLAKRLGRRDPDPVRLRNSRQVQAQGHCQRRRRRLQSRRHDGHHREPDSAGQAEGEDQEQRQHAQTASRREAGRRSLAGQGRQGDQG
ncbi:MAG: PKD domain-containing protein, partial [Acidimicrobiaceae bacterium]